MSLRQRSDALVARAAALIRAIQENDASAIEQAVLRLSQSRRIFAPLAFAVGAFVLLFDGLRLMISNWRLLIVQILPAMWIWLAMFNLKIHVLHGHQFRVIRGPVLIPLVLLVTAITIACFYLNAAFAFAIGQERRPPEVRPALRDARQPHAHDRRDRGDRRTAARVLDADRHPLGPSVVRDQPRDRDRAADDLLRRRAGAADRGVNPYRSRREKLMTSAVGGAIGATVTAPPYLMGRIGLLMLGSKVLLDPGHHPDRSRRHAPGWSDRGGTGDQDERQARSRRPGRRPIDPTAPSP